MAVFTEARVTANDRVDDGSHSVSPTAFAADRRTTGELLDDGGHTHRFWALSGDRQSVSSLPDNGGHQHRLWTFHGDHVVSPETLTQGNSIVVPTSSFERVHVTVVDEQGNRLPEVDWIMSREIFPTAAAVDENGEADMWLLAVTYDTFMAVAERRGGSGQVDYTWYSSSDQQESIQPLFDSEADIILEPEEIRGNMAGGPGIDFGGMLG